MFLYSLSTIPSREFPNAFTSHSHLIILITPELTSPKEEPFFASMAYITLYFTYYNTRHFFCKVNRSQGFTKLQFVSVHIHRLILFGTFTLVGSGSYDLALAIERERTSRDQTPFLTETDALCMPAKTFVTHWDQQTENAKLIANPPRFIQEVLPSSV